MAIVTQTDRPKSVRNCCVIEVFGCVLCCHVGFWIFKLDVGAFVIGEDLFFFLFINKYFMQNEKKLLVSTFD